MVISKSKEPIILLRNIRLFELSLHKLRGKLLRTYYYFTKALVYPGEGRHEFLWTRGISIKRDQMTK
jgi:hypothetical protein